MLDQFLRWAAIGAVKSGRVMHCRVLRDLDRSLHAGLRRSLSIITPRMTRSAVEVTVDKIGSDMKPARGGRRRPTALLPMQGNLALVKILWTGTLSWKVRRRLSVNTYAALGTQAAPRPFSKLRIRRFRTHPRR